jgi:hypothetical protein
MYSNAFNCPLSPFDKFRKLNFHIQYFFTSNYLLKPNFANLCRTLCKSHFRIRLNTDLVPFKLSYQYPVLNLISRQILLVLETTENPKPEKGIFPSCKTVLKIFQRCIWILRIRKIFYLFDKRISIAGFISSKELRTHTCTILKAFSCS